MSYAIQKAVRELDRHKSLRHHNSDEPVTKDEFRKLADSLAEALKNIDSRLKDLERKAQKLR